MTIFQFSTPALAIAFTDFTLDAPDEWTARIEYSYRLWIAKRYHLLPKYTAQEEYARRYEYESGISPD